MSHGLDVSREASRVALASINIDLGGQEVKAESSPQNMNVKAGEIKPLVWRMLTIPGSKGSHLDDEEDIGVHFEAKKDVTNLLPQNTEPISRE